MQEVCRREIREAEDQIDSSGVRAWVEDHGKGRGPIFKGCRPLLGCSSGREAGSRLNSRAQHSADTHPFGFRRVKPRLLMLTLDLAACWRWLLF